MSKDTLYEQEFKCKCKGKQKFLTWLSEVDNHTCTICNYPFIPIYIERDSAPNYIISSKHAKGRGKEVAKQRRIDDFKKNTMPTLPVGERRYFEKKYGKNKK